MLPSGEHDLKTKLKCFKIIDAVNRWFIFGGSFGCVALGFISDELQITKTMDIIPCKVGIECSNGGTGIGTDNDTDKNVRRHSLFGPKGHGAASSVKCIAVDGMGKLAATGDDAGGICLWEVVSATSPSSSGSKRCGLRLLCYCSVADLDSHGHGHVNATTPTLDALVNIETEAIRSLSFLPDKEHVYLSVATSKRVFVVVVNDANESDAEDAAKVVVEASFTDDVVDGDDETAVRPISRPRGMTTYMRGRRFGAYFELDRVAPWCHALFSLAVVNHEDTTDDGDEVCGPIRLPRLVLWKLVNEIEQQQIVKEQAVKLEQEQNGGWRLFRTRSPPMESPSALEGLDAPTPNLSSTSPSALSPSVSPSSLSSYSACVLYRFDWTDEMFDAAARNAHHITLPRREDDVHYMFHLRSGFEGEQGVDSAVQARDGITEL